VEEFQLMSATALCEGLFKPSSALALVDFLIRHGCVTEQNDTRFAQVCMVAEERVGPANSLAVTKNLDSHRFAGPTHFENVLMAARTFAVIETDHYLPPRYR
jgi:hypothetical protein